MTDFKFTRDNCLDNWQRTLWDAAQEEVKERLRTLAQGFADNGNYFVEVAIIQALEGPRND
jgi:hypothetical protein